MKASLRIGRIFGIPIKIHYSFLLILPLFGLSFAYNSVQVFGITLGFGNLPVDDLTKLLLGLIASVLFFIAVLLHELAHSYIAIKNGYVISGITLLIFGGVSEIEKQPPGAPGEAFMAFVGPASSIILGLLLFPFWLVLNGLSGLLEQTLAIMFGLMSFYNVFLGAFNIIPAFPLDGGRVFRALLAKRIGFARATKVAIQTGKVIALIMAFVGILVNIWLIVIAIFIYFGAAEEEKTTLMSQTLEGVKVSDVMTRDVSTADPNMSAKQLLEKMMREKHLGFPVIDNGHLVGMVALQDVQRVPAEQQDVVSVRQIMSPQVVSVPPTMSAMEAIQMVTSKRIGRLAVVDKEQLVGIVTRSDLIKMMELRQSREALAPNKT
jgi:Zn-dependent protease/predicted transcriptional regulator